MWEQQLASMMEASHLDEEVMSDFEITYAAETGDASLIGAFAVLLCGYNHGGHLQAKSVSWSSCHLRSYSESGPSSVMTKFRSYSMALIWYRSSSQSESRGWYGSSSSSQSESRGWYGSSSRSGSTTGSKEGSK